MCGAGGTEGSGGVSFEEHYIALARLLGFEAYPPGVWSHSYWCFRFEDCLYDQYDSEYMAAREFIRLSGNWTHMERALDAQEIPTD